MKTNVKTTIPTRVTFEGARAKIITPLQELWRTLSACLLWEDTFYESGESIAERIKTLTLKVDPHEAAMLAREARTAMKLRHAPLWVARWLASGTPAQKAHVAELLNDIIQRPDELTEFLALYWKDGKTPIAASVKRGLAQAFQKFSAYSLAKYNRDGAIKLRDVLFLVHAKPKNQAQAKLWKKLVENKLPVPDTWEVALSSGEGTKTLADKKKHWTRLLRENKLGALALLRNLRNMQQADVPVTLIKKALSGCQTERVLPFRFLSAAKYAPQLEPQLEALMLKSLEDSPKLPGKTILLVDGSGSMFGATISAKSELERYDAACALAILLREICEDVVIATFSTEVRQVPPRRGFALRDILVQGAERGGTMTEGAKRAADQQGYDRLIILTDEQSHQVLSAPQGLGYVINVGSYQNGVGYGDWVHIDGWSEAVVTYIQTLEATRPEPQPVKRGRKTVRSRR